MVVVVGLLCICGEQFPRSNASLHWWDVAGGVTSSFRNKSSQNPRAQQPPPAGPDQQPPPPPAGLSHHRHKQAGRPQVTAACLSAGKQAMAGPQAPDLRHRLQPHPTPGLAAPAGPLSAPRAHTARPTLAQGCCRAAATPYGGLARARRKGAPPNHATQKRECAASWQWGWGGGCEGVGASQWAGVVLDLCS